MNVYLAALTVMFERKKIFSLSLSILANFVIVSLTDTDIKIQFRVLA